MAGTDTVKADETKADAKTDNSEPEKQERTYFLPATGESVQATSAAEAAKLAGKEKKGNEG